jgi:hypothetical protein
MASNRTALRAFLWLVDMDDLVTTFSADLMADHNERNELAERARGAREEAAYSMIL